MREHSHEPYLRPLLQTVRSRLEARAFLFNVSMLVLGSGISQLIVMAVAPVITRLYSPEEFGRFGAFLSIVSILSVITTGRYELGIMLPKDDGDAFNLAVLSLLLCLGVGIILLIVPISISLLRHLHQNSNILTSLGELIWLISPAVTLSGLSGILRNWLNRKALYKKLATMSIVQSLSASIIQILLGMISVFGSVGLVIGRLVGDTLFAIIGGKTGKPETGYLSQLHWRELVLVARHYKKFPLFTMPSGLLNKINSELPSLLLYFFWGPAAAGYYALTVRVLNRPIGFVSTAVRDVFYREFTETRRKEGNSSRLLMKVSLTMLLFSLIPILIISIWAPSIIGWIFGSEWIEAGIYVRLLAPAIVAQFVVASTGLSMYTMGKQKLVLFWTVTYLMFSVIAFAFGKMADSISLAVGAYATVSVLMYAGYFFINLHFSKGQN